ncbi:MAG: hypothetical protein ACR2KL_07360 [Nocardioidaceae bacterium]
MTTSINSGRPFRLDQVGIIGLSATQLPGLLRSGQLRRVLRGVYIDASVSDTRQVRTSAARLVMPSHGVLMGCSASWLLSVDTFAPSDRFDLSTEWMVPHGQTRCVRAGVRCREGYLPLRDITTVDGVPVTTPTRTATDLLRKLRRPWALAAADGLAHAGLTTPEQIATHLTRLNGYPGIVQARELAALVEPKAESSAESCQRLRLIDAGFPRPRPQYVVADHRGRVLARLDHAYVEQRIGCEHDGAAYHSHDQDRDADAERRAYLTNVLDWRIVVTRREDIFGRDDAFEREVGDLLGLVPRLPRLW